MAVGVGLSSLSGECGNGSRPCIRLDVGTRRRASNRFLGVDAGLGTVGAWPTVACEWAESAGHAAGSHSSGPTMNPWGGGE